MTLGQQIDKPAYDEFLGGFRPVSAPTATAEEQNTGPSCREKFGSQAARELSRNGVGEVAKKEGLDEREADRTGSGSSEKSTSKNRSGVRQRGRREAVVCQKTLSCTHTVRAKEGRKDHRAEEGSALVGQRIFRAVRVGRRERLYERSERRQERPPTDAGPARTALAALD